MPYAAHVLFDNEIRNVIFDFNKTKENLISYQTHTIQRGKFVGFVTRIEKKLKKLYFE